MKYSLFKSVLITPSRLKELIYHHLHRQSIQQVQACYYDSKTKQFTNEVETRYPIERIKRYNQITTVKWMLKHEHHQLLKYKLKRVDLKLEEELRVRCIYNIAKVKDTQLIDTLYTKYREYFEDVNVLQFAIKNNNLYLYNLLMQQSTPCKFPASFTDSLEVSLQCGVSKEFIEIILLSRSDHKIDEIHLPPSLYTVIERMEIINLLFKHLLCQSEYYYLVNNVDKLSKYIFYLDCKSFDLLLSYSGINDKDRSKSIATLFTKLTENQLKAVDHGNLNYFINRLLVYFNYGNDIQQIETIIDNRLNQYFNFNNNNSNINNSIKIESIFYLRLLESLEIISYLPPYGLISIIVSLIQNNNDNLELVSYLMNYETRLYIYKGEYGNTIFEILCKYGTLEQIKHAHSIIGVGKNSIGRVTYRAMDIAAQRGDLEIVKFLHLERNEQCSQEVFHTLTSLEVTKYLIENKPVLKKYLTAQQALESLDMNIMIYVGGLDDIKKRSVVLSRMIIEKIFLTKHHQEIVNIFSYLKKSKCLSKNRYYHLLCEASRLGNKELIHYIFKKSGEKEPPTPPQFKTSVLDVAFLNGHYDIAKYLIKKMSFTKESFIIAGRVCTIKEVNLFIAKYKSGMPDEFKYLLSEALRYGNSTLIDDLGKMVFRIQDTHVENILDNVVFSIRMGQICSIQQYLGYNGNNIKVDALKVIYLECMLNGVIDGGKLVYSAYQEKQQQSMINNEGIGDILTTKQIHHIISKRSIRVIQYLISIQMIKQELIESFEFPYIHYTSFYIPDLTQFYESIGFKIDKSFNHTLKTPKDNYTKKQLIPIYPSEQNNTQPIHQVFKNKDLLLNILSKTRIPCTRDPQQLKYYRHGVLRDKLLICRGTNISMHVNQFKYLFYLPKQDGQILDHLIQHYSHFFNDNESDLIQVKSLDTLKKLMTRKVYTTHHIVIFLTTFLKKGAKGNDLNDEYLHYLRNNHPHLLPLQELVNLKQSLPFHFLERYFPNGIDEPIPCGKDGIYHSVLDSYYYKIKRFPMTFTYWKYLIRKTKLDPNKHYTRLDLVAEDSNSFWYYIHNIKYNRDLSFNPNTINRKLFLWYHIMGLNTNNDHWKTMSHLKLQHRFTVNGIQDVNWKNPLLSNRKITKYMFKHQINQTPTKIPINNNLILESFKEQYYIFEDVPINEYNRNIHLNVPISKRNFYMFLMHLDKFKPEYIFPEIAFQWYKWCQIKNIDLSKTLANVKDGLETNKLLKEIQGGKLTWCNISKVEEKTLMTNEYIDFILSNCDQITEEQSYQLGYYIVINVIDQNDTDLFKSLFFTKRLSHSIFQQSTTLDILRKHYSNNIVGATANNLFWDIIAEYLTQIIDKDIKKSSLVVILEMISLAAMNGNRYVAKIISKIPGNGSLVNNFVKGVLSDCNTRMLEYLIKIYGLKGLQKFIIINYDVGKMINKITPKMIEILIPLLNESLLQKTCKKSIIDRRIELIRVLFHSTQTKNLCSDIVSNHIDLKDLSNGMIDRLYGMGLLNKSILIDQLKRLENQDKNQTDLINHIKKILLKRKLNEEDD